MILRPLRAGRHRVTRPLVCVTGGTGYLGSHCVRAMLDAGYRVRTTVRDPNDAAKTAHVRALGEVTLFEADLLTPGSFDAAFEGCDYVLHTASVVLLNAKDPQRQIVQPAIEGTKNVLESVVKAGTVKRVVQTSSIVAIIDAAKPAGHLFDEQDWNDSASLDDPYPYAKTTAERQARQFVERLPEAQRFGLVAIHPTYILGPVLHQNHARGSPSLIRDLLCGKFPLAPDLAFGMVDVRDVAQAHLRAMEAEAPGPRYLCTNLTLTIPEMSHVLRRVFPKHRAPRFRMPNAMMYGVAAVDKRVTLTFLRRNLGVRRAMDNYRIRAELGVEFRPIAESMKATGESMIALGVVPAR